jgi:hypothetical protein
METLISILLWLAVVMVGLFGILGLCALLADVNEGRRM